MKRESEMKYGVMVSCSGPLKMLTCVMCETCSNVRD